ncbi:MULTISPECIES: GNAT family N-acetyltransferase [Bacillus]|uniref:GNAT family N-acetyltransferase n=1 Tax=Bacillus TaxID=1386 RepID=UPI0020BFECA4|nr:MULTISPECIES: GNAT family N-acetyltransferase [Bacillus]MED1747369.1 GNAT family N-acetyltransferase [Bacillus zhangzhouensis]UUD42312.1 GNAT family N-acetyltransferase [Bacillus pumilus]
MYIQQDALTDGRIDQLITGHVEEMKEHSPPESIHALPLDDLKKQDVTVWSVWDGEELLGCGAIKELSSEHGEIKSMRTAALHMRKGVARQMLTYLLQEAKQRGYTRVSLETGAMAFFEPARRLYESFGFQYCPPFGSYQEDPNSLFMTKEL